MNGVSIFHDTFDNFSFSDSGKLRVNIDHFDECKENTVNFNVPTETTTPSNSKENVSLDDSAFFKETSTTTILKENVSFNDSVFFSESFSSLSSNNVNRSKKRDSEDLFSDSEIILENLTTKECLEDLNNHEENQTAHPISISEKENNISKENNKCNLEDWGLPSMVLQKYKSRNISSMFTWQCECLSKPNILEKGKNLVYSAPTSAGKTLVAEILAIKTVFERSKKVLFILPFVSVVREKMVYFQDILNTSGIRVDGFMGSYNPPGGFHSIQVAICTIEKANSIVNRLLEEKTLSDLGMVIIDEIHLVGDNSRGYLLELLLTKLRYMSIRDENVSIQIVGMSATLPNLDLLAKWLDADLYTTEFRPVPLHELCHVNGEIYNNKLEFQRKLPVLSDVETDTDNILQLCLETIEKSCSVLIFCPSKNWCENLAQQIASAFWKLGNSKSDLGELLRQQLNSELISELLQQLKRCPVGLDKILAKTASFAVAFHHAGLTMDERDIIEGAFRSNVLRVLVATSTLSSGVNLPARRVIIRSPMFGGKPINILTYKQMIGRAGRMGKDVAGESILICQKNDCKIAKELMTGDLEPIESCLVGASKLKRAILEVITSGVASTPEDVNLFTNCTLLAIDQTDLLLNNPIEEAMKFLQKNEFIRLKNAEDGSLKYVATSLAKACLSSSLPPEEGIALFAELGKARQCFVLESELHLVYLVTPYSACNQWGNIDWLFYLEMWERLPNSMKRVGELVGVSESYIIGATRGKIQANTNQAYHKLQIHKRFYTALALQELVNEVPLNEVATKFNCSRGMLQSLQQSASTFAGMVTAFSKQLGWTSVEILISQFQGRLHFGVSYDLLDLMRLPVLNGHRARVLYNSGIETLVQLASSEPSVIENILHKALPFESEKEREGESEYEAQKRNKIRTIWITGQQGLTEREAAEMLVNDARQYLKYEIGLTDAKWEDDKENESKQLDQSNVVENRNQKGNTESPNVKKQRDDSLSVKNQTDDSPSVRNQTDDSPSVRNQRNESPSISNERDESINIRNERDEFPSVRNQRNQFLGITNERDEFSSVRIQKDDPDSLINDSLETSINLSLSYLNVKSKSETKNTTADLNWSSESLFIDSFENHPIEKNIADNSQNQNPNNSIAVLENAFLSSFNLDSSSKSGNNSSSDCIATSQNQEDAYSTLNLLSSVRKRARISDGNRNSSTDEQFTAQTPQKKPKLIKKKAKKIKLDSTFVITQDKAVTASYKLRTKLPKVNLGQFEIVDVSNNSELFACFCEELQLQNEISLSLACTRFLKEKSSIGQNHKHEENKDTEFIYESRRVEGISVTWGGNTAFYLKCSQSSIDLLKRLFKKTTLKVKIFDGKDQIKAMKLCCSIDFDSSLEDPKIGDWLLNPEEKEKNLQAMAMRYSPEAGSMVQMAGNCKGVGSIGLDLNSSIHPRIRSSVEAIVVWHLMQSVTNALAEQDMKLLHTYYIEMSAILLLTKMELLGIGISLEKLENLSEILNEQSAALEKKAYRLAGRNFSFSSPTEVAKILGLYKGKHVSTSKQVLGQNSNPIASLIIQWRKLNSTLSKMVYPIMRMAKNDRIYGSCILRNATGRITMHEPNLQNVPRNFEILNPVSNKLVHISCRSAFVCSASYVLLSADYCQLELRLLAHLSKDSSLCAVMRSEEDIFKSVAAKINNVLPNEVTDELRQRAKQICYGIIYGMGLKGLSEQIGTSEAEASQYLQQFHEQYPGIKQYAQVVTAQCKEDGYVETIAGRRRYLPHINHKHASTKGQAERQAVNTTIQGSAADIAKNAMVVINSQFQEKFKSSKNKPQLVLHLHDEFLYEVPVKYIKTAAKIVKRSMEDSVKLSVPFPVKIKTGSSWGDLKETDF